MRNGSFVKLFLVVTAVTFLGMALNPAFGNRGRGRHKQLHVVPTPGDVTIDAKLDDWDLSGQIGIFVEEATRATQNAKIAAMYDENAFYISGEVHDPNPMLNRHDPEVNAGRAWDADACQFRMIVDPEAKYPPQESKFKYGGEDAPKDTRDDIVHLLLWHYTEEGTANLLMQQGMTYRKPHEDWTPDGLVPKDKFEGEYRKWDNGLGYTFEYRIPWDTLGADNPPEPGDMLAGTTNVFWARPDGLSTAGGSAWAYDVMREPGFPWQSTNVWGKLQFREEGNVPREVVTQNLPPERPLPLKFQYELPADGETAIQLFADDGEVSRILVPQQERLAGVNTERWDGMDNHGEVDDRGGLIPAGEYDWRGIFSKEGVELEYRFSVHNSGNPPYRTPDQTGGWGGDHGTPQTVVAAEDFMLMSWDGSEAGWGIIRTDVDGQKKWGSGRNARVMATDGKRVYRSMGNEVTMVSVEEPRPVKLPKGPPSLSLPEGEDNENGRITGLAYNEGTLYVASEERDLIALFDTTDGAVLETWNVEKPGRMAVRPDGSIAVISADEKVLSVDDGETQEWLTEKLDEPVGVAVDDEGNAYVANRGDLQNVSVFDADGTYVDSIGREGGRPPMGEYDPTGMYMAGGIDVDARGRLWVAETADCPKRISVWDTETGENVDEFFGASAYFAYGYIDEDRPDEIYARNVLWDIDWDNYDTEPKSTVWRATDPNMAPAPNTGAHTSGGGFRIITAENGHQYGWGGAGGSRGTVFYIRDGNLFRPVAGIINPWKDSFPALEDYTKKLDKKWNEEGLAGYKRPHNQFWQDKNGDGKVSPDEMTIVQGIGHPTQLKPDLRILTTKGYMLHPKKVTDSGRPVYDLKQPKETPWVGKKYFGGRVMQAPDGSVYTLGHRKGPSLIKWTPEGEKAWYYSDLIRWRDALGLPTPGPGRLWGMTRPMGIAGDFIAYQTYFGIKHVFREDGMYVGSLLDASGSAEQPYVGQSEGQGAAFVKLNIDGEERYFVIGGSHDVRVWEVHGLDTLQDLPGGTYVHTEEKVQKARKAYQEYKAKAEGIEPLEIVQGRDALADADAVSRDLEGDRGIEARMAYDDENLYVQYNVESPHGLTNNIPDPKRIFLGGNCLDLQIATNPQADPEREKPAPGDVRLLVTRQDGETVAVLYRPNVADFDGDPILFESPTGDETFDSIEVIDSVKLDYSEEGNGFTAEIAVPLDVLDLELSSGDSVTMDVGYVFGNAKGSESVDRAYLYNESFTANVVDDLPHESRLEPHEWGKGVVQ